MLAQRFRNEAMCPKVMDARNLAMPSALSTTNQSAPIVYKARAIQLRTPGQMTTAPSEHVVAPMNFARLCPRSCHMLPVLAASQGQKRSNIRNILETLEERYDV